MLTGQTVDFNRHCRYEFGQYVQTHKAHDNTMIPRTIGALALRPTGNTQGNYYHFSLSSGRVINRAHATPLPMPDDVIERVHILARLQRTNPRLIFLDRNLQPHLHDNFGDETDDDNESDYGDDNPQSDDDSDDLSDHTNADNFDDPDDDDRPDPDVHHGAPVVPALATGVNNDEDKLNAGDNDEVHADEDSDDDNEDNRVETT